MIKKIEKTIPYRIARRIKRMFFPKKIVLPEWHIVQSGLLKGKKLYLANDGSWKKEMVEGTYESDFFYGYLQKLDLKGKTICDIGAHMGYYSMVFAELTGNSGKVFAFEPNPYNYERLKKNIVENDNISEIVKVLPYALSDKDGEEDFMFEPRAEKSSSTGGFLWRSDTVWEKSTYEKKIGFIKKTVETRTLDSLISEGMIAKPDLIKIDIEGGEYLMLSGARNTLLKDRPILLIEVHSIFNMWKVSEELKDMYELSLISEDSGGRCFFMAKPIK